ncbi:hypothetical protein C8J57DRAFT_1227013 [Mycena rebaudengoi]|nr:hypothetical protein C8J57DRAFT_1227013 [Mycena rebaudengoi]
MWEKKKEMSSCRAERGLVSHWPRGWCHVAREIETSEVEARKSLCRKGQWKFVWGGRRTCVELRWACGVRMKFVWGGRRTCIGLKWACASGEVRLRWMLELYRVKMGMWYGVSRGTQRVAFTRKNAGTWIGGPSPACPASTPPPTWTSSSTAAKRGPNSMLSYAAACREFIQTRRLFFPTVDGADDDAGSWYTREQVSGVLNGYLESRKPYTEAIQYWREYCRDCHGSQVAGATTPSAAAPVWGKSGIWGESAGPAAWMICPEEGTSAPYPDPTGQLAKAAKVLDATPGGIAAAMSALHVTPSAPFNASPVALPFTPSAPSNRAKCKILEKTRHFSGLSALSGISEISEIMNMCKENNCPEEQPII